MNNPRPAPAGRRGFTLVEAVLVIVITGILGAVVAVFIRAPVEGYFDTVRRADMTDAADGALRRIARDVRSALPNSLRQTTGAAPDQCFEFLPTVGGGRYRVAPPGDVLDFSIADTSFDVLGDPPAPNSNLPSFAGSTFHAVIYNLGIPGANAYDANDHNRATINNGSTTNIVLNPGNKFPLESPFKRFDVIPNYSVAYSCSGGNLIRSTQLISATPFAACPSAGAVLASNVSFCSFSYTPAVSQRNGLLTMTLGLTQSGESIRLYHEVHVNNVP